MDDKTINVLANGLVDRVKEAEWDKALNLLKNTLKRSHVYSNAEIEDGIVKIKNEAVNIASGKTSK